MSTELSRQQFEEWFRRVNPEVRVNFRRQEGGYAWAAVDLSWRAWQAARKVVTPAEFMSPLRLPSNTVWELLPRPNVDKSRMPQQYGRIKRVKPRMWQDPISKTWHCVSNSAACSSHDPILAYNGWRQTC